MPPLRKFRRAFVAWSRWAAIDCISAPEIAPSRYSENCDRVEEQEVISPPCMHHRRIGHGRRTLVRVCWRCTLGRCSGTRDKIPQPNPQHGTAPYQPGFYGAKLVPRFPRFRRRPCLPDRAESRLCGTVPATAAAPIPPGHGSPHAPPLQRATHAHRPAYLSDRWNGPAPPHRLLRFDGHFAAAMPRPPAALVGSLMQRDAVNPGSQAGVAMEAANPAEYLDENILGDVGSVGGVFQKAGNQGCKQARDIAQSGAKKPLPSQPAAQR